MTAKLYFCVPSPLKKLVLALQSLKMSCFYFTFCSWSYKTTIKVSGWRNFSPATAKYVSGKRALFWAACSLDFFEFLRVRKFTCSGPFDPRIRLFPVRRVVRSLGQLPPPHQVFDHGPFRRGVLLFIGPSGNSLCPVSAPRHSHPLRGYVPGPLFASSNGCSLLPFLVNSWLRYFSHSLNYSSHTFRIGAAISAADCESSSSPYHNSWSPVQ